MRFRSALLAGAAIALALVACTDDRGPEDSLPVADAERIRDLRFKEAPIVERITRDAYLRAQAAKGVGLSDARVAYLRGTWGRLGFFKPSFDVRSASGGQAALVGAYYDFKTNKITVFENPSPEILLHELVHALQDQNFDLDAYSSAATSTDEALARRAIVEGDATLSHVRYRLEREGRDPVRDLTFIDFNEAKLESDKLLLAAELPAFFAANPAFVYSFGTAFASRQVGLLEVLFPRYQSRAMDASFGEAAPRSTKEVLRAITKRPAEPIAEVGLARLPVALADRYDLDSVDRLGAWYTHILLRPAPGHLLEASLEWTGDQLVVLDARDLKIPRETRPPSGVVWTVSWIGAEQAARFRSELRAVLAALPAGDAAPAEVYVAHDGEMMWLEQRDANVVLVKGLPVEDMRVLAAAALGDRERRLGVARRVAIEKIIGLGEDRP